MTMSHFPSPIDRSISWFTYFASPSISFLAHFHLTPVVLIIQQRSDSMGCLTHFASRTS